MNEDILQEKRRCRKLEQQWQSSELAVHKEMFILQKSIVKSMCDKATYYRDKVDNCEQSKLFKLAESLLHGKEKKSLPDHKNLITLVDEFNHFFIMKIVNIRLKLESACHMLPLTNSSSPTSVTTLTEFQSLTSEMVSKLIKSASSATYALDPIPSKLVKSEWFELLLHVICNLINKSRQSGECVSYRLQNCKRMSTSKKALLRPE